MSKKPAFAGPPVNICPSMGSTWVRAATPFRKTVRPVRSIGPLPVATTLLPCCVRSTTYPARAGGAERPISIAAPRLALPLMKIMGSSLQVNGRRAARSLNVARNPSAPGASISYEAQSREAEQHHGPGRGFRDRTGSDDEREVLVRPAPPRPFVSAGRRAEAAKCLAVVGRGVRQRSVGDVGRRQDKLPKKDANLVSAAAAGKKGDRATAKARRPSDTSILVAQKGRWPGKYNPHGGVYLYWPANRAGKV